MADHIQNTQHNDELLNQMSDREKRLVEWILPKVEDWEKDRNLKFEEDWNRYERIWRGVWSGEDKHRVKERSRLVPPQLMEAVDVATADLEDAFFGRSVWFDIQDDEIGRLELARDVNEAKAQPAQPAARPGAPAQPGQLEQNRAVAQQAQVQQRQENALQQRINKMGRMRDLMLEDFDLADVPRNISESILLGALFGTMIGKVVVEEVKDKSPVTRLGVSKKGQLQIEEGVSTTDAVRIFLEPVSPFEFVIDPATTRPGTEGINQALGCAHMIDVPRHTILQKQRTGVYNKFELGNIEHTPVNRNVGSIKSMMTVAKDTIKIIEYHGFVPTLLLKKETDEDKADVNLEKMLEEVAFKEMEDLEHDDADFTEAIVTIGNGILLKAIKNPHMMEDRSFVAAQFDTVPRTFWGRGILEKGYHSHRALEAELRARIDALAFSVHPLLGVNGLWFRSKDNEDIPVYAGKTFYTPGTPRNFIDVFKFSDVSASTFSQTGELERMLKGAVGQIGAGVQDGKNPVGPQGAMSIQLSGAVKRAKRTLTNIERGFLVPFITKAAWRYMQFENVRYPANDYKFSVHGAMSVMQREVEQGHFIQLLGYLPRDGSPVSPEAAILLSGIIENSSLSNKDDMLALIKNRLAPNPDAEFLRNMGLANAKLELQRTQSEIDRNNAEARKALAGATYNTNRLDVEVVKKLLDLSDNQKDRVLALLKDSGRTITVQELTPISSLQESTTIPEVDEEVEPVPIEDISDDEPLVEAVPITQAPTLG